jgi:hypothetical protein
MSCFLLANPFLKELEVQSPSPVRGGSGMNCTAVQVVAVEPAGSRQTLLPFSKQMREAPVFSGIWKLEQ